MANYRKSFNLRNGVQIDDDNFVVNANGLVGIGTSVPTEYLLNVYGDTRVTGLVTTKNLSVSGVATVGILSVTQDVSVSGVVTAASFSGSASGLTDIYAIAVDGWRVTSGSISTTSNVGVGTTNPNGTFQVGTGVTINSNGNATYSGIITASSFTGNLTGTATTATNVIGGIGSITQLSVSGVSTFVSVGATTLNVTGVSTLATLGVSGVTTTQHLNVTGVSTFVSVGATTLNVTGVSTFNDNVYISSSSVGIGTTNPGASLHVTPTSTNIAGLFSGSTDGDMVRITQTGNGNAFVIEDGDNPDATPFVVAANGNVGVGTITPSSSYKLRVHGVGVNNSYIQITNATEGSGDNKGLMLGYDSGANRQVINSWVLPLLLNTSVNTAPIVIQPVSSRKVGIGSTLPNNKLDVIGDVYVSENLGIGTTNPRYNLDVYGTANITGVITASSFSGNLTGNINGEVYSLGVSTFTTLKVGTGVTVSNGIVTASSFSGNLSGNATGLSGSPNIDVGIVTASSIVSGISSVGVSTVNTSFYVKSDGTAFSALNTGRVGIGTAIPTSELQIRKTAETLLEIISDTSEAKISIGQSVGVGRSSSYLRFGSQSKTFDIANNDTGNINFYLHAGPSGVGTGRFDWYYGQNISNPLMSLTYVGNLGLGVTDPSTKLYVDGTSYFTGISTFVGISTFKSDVSIEGTLKASSLNIPSINTQLIGNVYAASGISTFNRIETLSNVIVSSGSSIGIGTTRPIADLDARGKIGLFSNIGIGTTSTTQSLKVIGSTLLQSVSIGNTNLDDGSGVNIYGGTTTLSSNTVSGINTCVVILDNTSTLGVGTTSYRSALDFGDAGKNSFGGIGAYMIVPRLSNSQRAGLSTVEGALIFNTDSKKFQGYTGVAWTDFH